ncbi:hypothetical protein [Brevibacillus centrosporus]|uniref:hypothetical protein n=1 Tax=Brevibacillus centrosporus TaxID=54910 RepID=UPI002E1B328D|nr:hypothetical protein [Brevibacillus centrosporus]
MEKHNVVAAFWSGVEFIQSIGKVDEYLKFAKQYLDEDEIEEDVKNDTFEYIKVCATSRTIEQYLEDKGETELLEYLNNPSNKEDEEFVFYNVTHVQVEQQEDNKYLVSLICDEEDSLQLLSNLARFTYRNDAIKYAVKIFVNDDVQLALIENDEVNFYDKEQAIKLMEVNY